MTRAVWVGGKRGGEDESQHPLSSNQSWIFPAHSLKSLLNAALGKYTFFFFKFFHFFLISPVTQHCFANVFSYTGLRDFTM